MSKKGQLRDDTFDKSVRSGISNPIDSILGWGYNNPRNYSAIRGDIHGVYHTFQGYK
jgi:hypothetical protein